MNKGSSPQMSGKGPFRFNTRCEIWDSTYNKLDLKAAFTFFGGEQFLKNQSRGLMYPVFPTPKFRALLVLEVIGESSWKKDY